MSGSISVAVSFGRITVGHGIGRLSLCCDPFLTVAVMNHVVYLMADGGGDPLVRAQV